MYIYFDIDQGVPKKCKEEVKDVLMTEFEKSKVKC